MGLADESPVPRRRGAVRADPGDDVLKDPRWDWAWETDPLRGGLPLAPAASFDPLWGGGFSGELIEPENN